MLTEQSAPFTGFGETQVFVSQLPSAYIETSAQASERLKAVFGISHEVGIECIREVEEVINQMWSKGWDPQGAKINLFTTDFGCLIAENLRQSLSGSLVLRSEIDLSHASIWWPEAKLEVFPFHAIYRRLKSQSGESVTLLAESAYSRLGRDE
jgi:hypothetical protein